MNQQLRIGVLAIQGGFSAHIETLKQLSDQISVDEKLEVVEVRKASDLDTIDGLIIPGGESSVLSLHLNIGNLMEKVKMFVKNKQKFTWGTCAGLILLSESIEGEGKNEVKQIGGLDITCKRNYSGRQNNSCESQLLLTDEDLVASNGNKKEFKGIFIRPPGVVSVNSPDVKVLSRRDSEGSSEVVAIRDGNVMACSFHPELCNQDSKFTWHRYFVKNVLKYKHFNI